MRIHRSLTLVLGAVLIAALGTAAAAPAAVFSQSYDFALDSWNEIAASDGPITLHRLRLDLLEGRLTKSSLSRPHNHEYLETARVQLEYTNESTSKWKARVTVRWLDEEGRVIDGIGANETLDKKSARKVASVSVATLKYGLERAKKLEVEIHYEP